MRNKGFTIVELLMVIGIMGILSSIMFTSYRGGVRQTNLRNGASELITVLRQSQTSASSGALYNGSAVADHRLNLDLAADSVYKVCVASTYCADNVVETVNLPDEVFIQAITLEGNPATGATKSDVIFKAPFGDIQFSGDTFSNQTTRILDIVLSNGAQTLTLKIDPISGRMFYE